MESDRTNNEVYFIYTVSRSAVKGLVKETEGPLDVFLFRKVVYSSQDVFKIFDRLICYKPSFTCRLF